MRICVLTQYFYPHAGGSQEYIVQLYQELRQLDPGLEVDVICYNTENAPQTESYKGLNIHRVGCVEILPGQFAIPNYFELYQLLAKLKKQHRYDFVNTHTRFFENSWWAPWAARYLGAQLILTDHCATHPTHSNRFLQSIIGYIDLFILKTVLHAYTHITVVSQTTQEFLKKFGHEGRVFVAGVDEKFTKRATENKNLVPLPPHSLCITYLGRMIKSKNPEALLKAAQTITVKYPQALVVFAGAGAELERLQSAHTDRIIFLGQLNRDQAVALLKKTDIFVYPSQHHEGLPISILEAAASGCAILATDNGGTKEIITDQKTGILITPTASDITEKLENLLNNPAQRKELGLGAQTKVFKDYQWHKTAQSFLQYLHSIQ